MPAGRLFDFVAAFAAFNSPSLPTPSSIPRRGGVGRAASPYAGALRKGFGDEKAPWR